MIRDFLEINFYFEFRVGCLSFKKLYYYEQLMDRNGLALQLLTIKIHRASIFLFQGIDMETRKILNKESFLSLLHFEVKRAQRYQHFFCILLLKLAQLPGHENRNENSLENCSRILFKLLSEDLRDSDILGSLEKNQFAILVPYADLSAIGSFKSRLDGNLKYCGFEDKGFEVMTDLVCFPVDGTDTDDLVGKLWQQAPSLCS
jgi:hypothetical protein